VTGDLSLPGEWLPDYPVGVAWPGLKPWPDTPTLPVIITYEDDGGRYERDRHEWIETVRQRYGLVTAGGGLPRQPCGMTSDGNYEGWYLDGAVSGRGPSVWRCRGDAGCASLTGLTRRLHELAGHRGRAFAPDEEMERLRHAVAQRRPHECDKRCACPVHGTQMIYWPAGDDHACQDVNCKYGHGCRPFGAFAPFSPILPVPVDGPDGDRPSPRRWKYHVGGSCATPQEDGTCGCGSRAKGGTTTSGRQYETDQVHPPEWHPS